MILVTGGAGFIGSHLVSRLIGRGESVLVIDDFNDYYNPRFKEQNIAPFNQNKQFVLLRGSVTDDTLIHQAFANYPIKSVIHLAARAGVRPSISDPLLYEEVNIRGTLTILEEMRKQGCQKFYYASSSSVYGNQAKVPFSETDDVSNPISPYAATKKACELLAYTYHHLYTMRCVGFRFFTVYGENGRPDMAPYLFTERILHGMPIKKYGDGTTERDYTYVEDIVDGILSALDKDFEYEVFNLGNSNTVSLNLLIQAIEHACKKEALIEQYPLQSGDVQRTFADIGKAQKLLGYAPKVSIEEGITRFVEWYKKNRISS